MKEKNNLELDNEIEKRFYELGFLMREERESLVKEILVKNNVEFVEEGKLVKVKLAYPIKKLNQAFFGYFRFASHPDKIDLIDKELKLIPEVIRFILIKLPKVVFRNFFKKEEPDLKKPKIEISLEEKKKTFPSSILTNEALEKKIEEILQ